MIDLLILWFLNCAVVSCWIFWWFESTLPVLATLLVRKVIDRPAEFWQLPDQAEFETMDCWTRADWNKWRTQVLMPEHPKLAHMLGCSRCISFHMSYMATLTLGAFGAQEWPLRMRALFFIVGAFGTTTIAHRLIPGSSSWTQK